MTNQELTQKLQELPSAIAFKTTMAEALRLDWQNAKARMDKSYAKHWLDTKAREQYKHQADIKHTVEELVYEEKLNVILKESEYRIKESEAKELENQYNACKIIARLKIAEMNSGIELPPTKQGGTENASRIQYPKSR